MKRFKVENPVTYAHKIISKELNKMKIYINLQSKETFAEGYVSDEIEFGKWLTENKPKGKFLYVVLPKEDSKEIFITPSIDAVINYFEHLFFEDKLFIQLFDVGDYNDALGYLSDLFELKEPPISLTDSPN